MVTFLLNDFADLVSFSSNSIEFHIFGNKAEGKHFKVLKRTRSSLYDFVLFGSAKELNISWNCYDRLHLGRLHLFLFYLKILNELY